MICIMQLAFSGHVYAYVCIYMYEMPMYVCTSTTKTDTPLVGHEAIICGRTVNVVHGIYRLSTIILTDSHDMHDDADPVPFGVAEV